MDGFAETNRIALTVHGPELGLTARFWNGSVAVVSEPPLPTARPQAFPQLR